jgi:AcrR family transcriptional regulator
MPTNDDAPKRGRRRARQRDDLIGEVKSIARGQLESGGRAGVSWRAIAREVGLDPASLYTYFDNLDDLFTALLLDSYDALAAAVEAAEAASRRRSARARLHDLAQAYRTWALAHRSQYNLLFTDQIPGYAAPPGGPTVAAQIRVFEPFRRALDDELGTSYATSATLSAAQERDLLGFFGLLHGLVTLEVNHHLDWTVSPRDRLLATQLDRLLDDALHRPAS